MSKIQMTDASADLRLLLGLIEVFTCVSFSLKIKICESTAVLLAHLRGCGSSAQRHEEAQVCFYSHAKSEGLWCPAHCGVPLRSEVLGLVRSGPSHQGSGRIYGCVHDELFSGQTAACVPLPPTRGRIRLDDLFFQLNHMSHRKPTTVGTTRASLRRAMPIVFLGSIKT